MLELERCVEEQCMTEFHLKKGEAGATAWREFVRLYGPVVYGFARRRGRRDAEAAALMQEVLRSVARNTETMEYDPKHGTFRGWFFTLTCNKLGNFLSAQKNCIGTTDSGSHCNSAPAREAGTDSDWEIEYRRQLSAKAMERMKREFHSSIWQAFWKTAIDGQPVRDVGVELKMTPGAVYVARCRVLIRFREEVRRLQARAEAW
jgi:RNA polymerase sigma factor (sigma-70 family)